MHNNDFDGKAPPHHCRRGGVRVRIGSSVSHSTEFFRAEENLSSPVELALQEVELV